MNLKDAFLLAAELIADGKATSTTEALRMIERTSDDSSAEVDIDILHEIFQPEGTHNRFWLVRDPDVQRMTFEEKQNLRLTMLCLGAVCYTDMVKRVKLKAVKSKQEEAPVEAPVEA